MSEEAPHYRTSHTGNMSEDTHEHDTSILIKSCTHLVRKAKPRYDAEGNGGDGGKIIGYLVPAREFERIKSKLGRLRDAQ